MSYKTVSSAPIVDSPMARGLFNLVKYLQEKVKKNISRITLRYRIKEDTSY
jgi:hypothetical protein